VVFIQEKVEVYVMFGNSEEMKRTCTVGEKGCGRGRGGGGREEGGESQGPYETLIVQDSKLAWGASICCSN